jgi:hypothetical protein
LPATRRHDGQPDPAVIANVRGVLAPPAVLMRRVLREAGVQ